MLIKLHKTSKDKISRSYRKETGETTKGEYDEVEKSFNEIDKKIDLDILSSIFDPITKCVSI